MKAKVWLRCLVFALLLCGCGQSEGKAAISTESPQIAIEDQEADEINFNGQQNTAGTQEMEGTEIDGMRLSLNGSELDVAWEDNDSVAALRALVQDKPLSISMSMYGGFEQVGSIGVSLPRDDVQTTTSAGDIVLYSGNQLVVFYGSNSWSYTRLGKIAGKGASEMAELLGNGDVMITISAGKK